MRVCEEPFTSRDAILAIFRPGQLVSESPFRTLRNRAFASGGLRADVRTSGGRWLGRAHLYSSLNTDAARAVRLRQFDLAERFATKAGELERSPEAQQIHASIREVASRMPADPTNADAPLGLQQYVRLRGRATQRGLDRDALAREWLVSSQAWLGADDEDTRNAVTALATASAQARLELTVDTQTHVSTFYGVVKRMDEFAAEVDGDDGSRLLPREELERQGLAAIGQAVALLCEELPAGGSLIVPMPAVALDKPVASASGFAWDLAPRDDGYRMASLLGKADYGWLEKRQSQGAIPVPVAPLRRA